MKKEKWKPIKGYEGLYEVSNLGRINSLYGGQSNKGGILKAAKDKKGYERICLTKNGQKRNYSVHRLVALTFIDNPHNKPQVNHIDGVHSNNSLLNLEWVTSSENHKHAWDNKLRTFTVDQEKHLRDMHSKQSVEVCQYDLNGKYIRSWKSISTASNELNIHHSNIVSACKLLTNSAGGFQWRYSKDTHSNDKILEIVPQSKKIIQYSKKQEFIKIWESITSASIALNIKRSQISGCCYHRHGYKTAGGYIWEFYKEDFL